MIHIVVEPHPLLSLPRNSEFACPDAMRLVRPMVRQNNEVENNKEIARHAVEMTVSQRLTSHVSACMVKGIWYWLVGRGTTIPQVTQHTGE